MGKYSLMVMKNESRAYRIKLGSFGITCIFLLMFFFPILCIASIWLNIHFFEENSTKKSEIANLKHELKKSEQKIARLSNLETFLQAHSPALVNLSLIDEKNVDQKQEAKEDENQTRPKNQEKNELKRDTQKQVEQAKLVPSQQKQAEVKQENLPLVQNAENQKEPDKAIIEKPKVEIAPPQENTARKIDLELVELQSMKVNYTASNLSVFYYLKKIGNVDKVAGEQHFTLINFEKGKLNRIPLNNKSVRYYSIANLKEIKITIPITGHEISPRARLQVDVEQEDGSIIFRDSFPIDR